MNETSIKNIKLIHPIKSNDTNSYNLTSFEIIHQNDAANFGIRIKFERNDRGRDSILINYHLMCAMLILVASINFLIDPNMVPGRAGMLVTLFLVTTGFFSDAQVGVIKKIQIGIF